MTVVPRFFRVAACFFALWPAVLQSMETSPADPAVGADYIIGLGDTLQVFVWRNPELTDKTIKRGVLREILANCVGRK